MDVWSASPSHVYGYPTGGGAGNSVVWTPLEQSDFVNPLIFNDPNSVIGGPLVFGGVGTGTITVTIAQSAVTRYDGMAEGASWQLNWPAAWRGDGTQAIMTRYTPLNDPNTQSMLEVGIGICDHDGDTQAVGAIMVGNYLAWSDTLNKVGGGIVNATSGVSNTYAFYSENPRVVGLTVPGGIIGDESTVGTPGGVIGQSAVYLFRRDISEVMWSNFVKVDTQTLNGVRPIFFAGLDNFPFVGNVDVSLKVEWAIIDLLPSFV